MLIHIEKLVCAEQCLAEIGEGLQFRRGFRSGFCFFVLLYLFRFDGFFLASGFQVIRLSGQKGERSGLLRWSRTSAEGKLPGTRDLLITIVTRFFLQALGEAPGLVEDELTVHQH